MVTNVKDHHLSTRVSSHNIITLPDLKLEISVMKDSTKVDLSEKDAVKFWRLNTPRKRAAMIGALKAKRLGDACYYVCERPQYDVGCGTCADCKLLLSIYSGSDSRSRFISIIMMAIRESEEVKQS